MKNLIICSASERSLHQVWLDGDPNRNWDLYLSPYRALAPRQSPDIEIGKIRSGPKFTCLHDLLIQENGWRRYQYITLADEDVFAMPGTWSRFFEQATEFNAALSAPALTPNSIYSHPVTVQQPGSRARRVSFVESMMPCFRVDILEKLLHTFALSPTGAGWGFDYLWAAMLDYQGIYVIDETPVTHWRPNVHTTNGFPEMNALLARFNVSPIEQTYEHFPAMGHT